MLYSIIIINYRTPELTIKCIDSILSLPKINDTEIIVIDNNSNDDSNRILKKRIKNIKLIINHKNIGFSAANNQGAEVSKGEYLIFLNSDTIVNNKFWEPCCIILDKNKKIGAISPRLKLPSGKNQAKSFGFFPSPWNIIIQKTKLEPTVNSNSDYQPFDWISGCSLIMRKKNFNRINGWDDNFFLYYEDIDLCYRLKKIQKLSVIALKESVVHLGGSSLMANKKKQVIYYKSQDYFLRKHYSWTQLVIVKLIRSIAIKIKKLSK